MEVRYKETGGAPDEEAGSGVDPGVSAGEGAEGDEGEGGGAGDQGEGEESGVAACREKP
jgi:hypothetical protein